MFFIGITKPKEKALILAGVLLLLLVLAWGIPLLHDYLVGATQAAVATQQQEVDDYASLGEPIRVLEDLSTLLNGGEIQLP